MKVSDSIKKAILADKKSGLSIKDLCEKHSISKATVHRVLASSKNEVSGDVKMVAETDTPPTLTIAEMSDEFVTAMNGKSKEQLQQEEKAQTKSQANAIERLADHLFDDDDSVDMPTVKAPRRSAAPKTVVKFQPPEETAVERNALEQRIILNIENFAPIFHFIKDKDAFIRSIPNKSTAELKGLLKTLETTRTTVNLSNQMKNTFFMASQGTEVLGAMFLGLKTRGFTEMLMSQQQELDMIFREIAIDYAPMFSMTNKPELRLGMIFAMTLMQTDSTNRLKESIRANQSLNSVGEQKTPDAQSPEVRFRDL
jgi:hypothetical protein